MILFGLVRLCSLSRDRVNHDFSKGDTKSTAQSVPIVFKALHVANVEGEIGESLSDNHRLACESHCITKFPHNVGLIPPKISHAARSGADLAQQPLGASSCSLTILNATA